MNRVTAAFDKMKTQIEERVRSGQTTREAVDRCSRSLDITVGEFCQLQELKSHAMGTLLSEEEAMTVYRALGESPETFNQQPVHIKAVLTKLFSELLQARRI